MQITFHLHIGDKWYPVNKNYVAFLDNHEYAYALYVRTNVPVWFISPDGAVCTMYKLMTWFQSNKDSAIPNYIKALALLTE